MDDELTQSVNDSGASADASTNQTPQESNGTPTGATPPSSDEERFAKVLEKVLPQYLGRMATKDEVSRAVQSATDKSYARLMKELSPKMRALEELGKDEVLTADQVEAQKQKLLLKALGNFQGEEPNASTSGGIDWNSRAWSYAAKYGLKPQDLPEVREFFKTNGVPMPFDMFIDLVNEKTLSRRADDIKRQAQKELETQQEQIKRAEQKGASKPPLGDGKSDNNTISNISDPKTLYKMALRNRKK